MKINDQSTKQSLQNIKDAMGYTPSNKEINNINNAVNANKRENIPIKTVYQPKLTAVFSSGEIVDLSSNLAIMQVDVNLNDFIFPLFSVRLNVPSSYVPKFQFDDSLQLKFEIVFNDMTNLDTPSMYESLFSTTLTKIKQISSPIIADEKLYEINDSYLKKIPLEMKLIPSECLSVNKNLFSGVYKNSSIGQLLCLITENIYNKTYLYPPDNTKKYKQIIFPPCNTFYAIQYLDQYYGIYNKGLKMFYGLNQSIIIPKNYSLPSGINKIQINFGTNETSGMSSSLFMGGFASTLGSDNYFVTTPDKVNIVDSRHYIKETLGTIINTFSRDNTTAKEQFREYTSNSDELQKVKTYINQYNNVSKENEMLCRTEYTKNLNIKLNSTIINPDSWFKPFSVNFESPYYQSLNGNYCMNEYSFIMKKNMSNNDSSTYDIISQLILSEI